jgi:hypothetical protein
MRNSKYWIFATVWLLLCQVGAAQDSWVTFPKAAPLPVEVDTVQPVRVVLSREWLQLSGPDQRGLRIRDDLGSEIPWATAIQSGQRVNETLHGLRVRNFSTSAEGEEILLQSTSGRITLTEVRISTRSRDFRRAVRLYGSLDSENWELIGEGMLFDASSRLDFRQLAVACKESTVEWIRMELLHDTERLSGEMSVTLGDRMIVVRDLPVAADLRIETVVAVNVRSADVEAVWQEWEFSNLQPTTTATGDTLFNLGDLNIPVEQIVVISPQPVYSRRARLQQSTGGDSSHFRNVISGVIEARLGANEPQSFVSGYAERVGQAQMLIENDGNPPLRVDAIRLRWYQRELVFIAEPGRSYVLLGGSPAAGVRRYDIAGMVGLEPQDLAIKQAWNAPAPVDNADWDPASTDPGIWSESNREILLTVIILILAAGIGFWIWRILRR